MYCQWAQNGKIFLKTVQQKHPPKTQALKLVSVSKSIKMSRCFAPELLSTVADGATGRRCLCRETN